MAIDDKLINRINELSKLKKQRTLTNEEAKEQKCLREEYLNAFRLNVKSALNNIDVVDELIVKDEGIESLEKKLENTKGIRSLENKQKHVVITYVCKEITEEEIILKIRENNEKKVDR